MDQAHVASQAREGGRDGEVLVGAAQVLVPAHLQAIVEKHSLSVARYRARWNFRDAHLKKTVRHSARDVAEAADLLKGSARKKASGLGRQAQLSGAAGSADLRAGRDGAAAWRVGGRGRVNVP